VGIAVTEDGTDSTVQGDICGGSEVRNEESLIEIPGQRREREKI
jgi:hypothetical protein